jgi:hypothetical protein
MRPLSSSNPSRVDCTPAAELLPAPIDEVMADVENLLAPQAAELLEGMEEDQCQAALGSFPWS